jgi:hypothetical protein
LSVLTANSECKDNEGQGKSKAIERQKSKAEGERVEWREQQV